MNIKEGKAFNHLFQMEKNVQHYSSKVENIKFKKQKMICFDQVLEFYVGSLESIRYCYKVLEYGTPSFHPILSTVGTPLFASQFY